MSPTVFKGWQAKIYISDISDLEIGTVTSMSLSYESPVEPYYELENPNMIPVTSVDQLGLIAVSGSLEKAWINTYYLKLLFGGDAPSVPNFEFELRVEASTVSGAPIIYLYNCRFKKGTINITQSGWITESYDFTAFTSGIGVH